MVARYGIIIQALPPYTTDIELQISLLVMSGVGVETAEEVVDAKVCDDDADKGDGNIYEEIA